jgi:hypothetical protein
MRQGPKQQWGGICAKHGWHCPAASRRHLLLAIQKKGYYRSNCPELQVQEINVGAQNLNIGNCEEGHGLFSSKEDKGLATVQDKEKE